MAWFAAFRGFPSTLCLAAASGRHGADNAVRGTVRRHHRAGMILSPRCPWRGVRRKWPFGTLQALEPRGPGRRPLGRGGLRCFATVVAGGSVAVASHHWLVLITPYPQPLGPLQGARGAGHEMAWFAAFRGFPSTLCLAAASGRHGADDVVGGPARRHHTRGRSLSPRCPWREVRYGVGSQFRFVSVLSSASPMGSDLAKRISSSLNFSAVQRRGKEYGCPK